MTEIVIDERIQSFIARLEKLEPGERARFKRHAGCSLGEAGDALGLFYRLIPYDLMPVQEEKYFLLASLFPLADGGGKGDLGAALRRAQTTANRKGIDRRVEILLDSDSTQLPFRLRQAIHFLQSNRVKVNWPWLLHDLLYWSHPDRFVQQAWARSYFS